MNEKEEVELTEDFVNFLDSLTPKGRDIIYQSMKKQNLSIVEYFNAGRRMLSEFLELTRN